MRKTGNRLSLIFALALTTILGCSAPKIRYRNVDLERITLTDSQWMLRFTVTNPNMIGVPIDALHYAGYIGDEPIAEGTTRGGVLIRGSSDSEVNLPISIPHRAVLAITRAAQSGSDLPYRIRGSVQIIGFTIPFENKGVYKIPPEMKDSLRGKKEELKDTLLRSKQLFKR
ncbi:MAG: LEA type 2 family protein [Bdellovibrionales bacterium]|nr:LEA type 2 family protein [Bdellovibrionales bacterium]